MACVATVRGGADPGAAPAGDLKVTLVSNKESYPLNPEQSGAEFRKLLAGNGRKPAASKVDLTLKVTNTSDHDVVFNWGGDDSNLRFTLTGEGAVTAPNMVPMTREFRIGKQVTINPGKSFELPIAALAGGMRGVSELSWFTEAGEYKLSATVTYPVGERQEKLTSEPITIKVTKAEAAK
jgi:hypothetical protein